MNLLKLLTTAGVPSHLHPEAIASLQDAERRARGLLWHKIKVRLFRAKKIAEMIPWHADRLIDVRPDLIDWDIAPMINITAHGDNGPWHSTPQGDRPDKAYWLNSDPESEEYKHAVSKNYWCEGEHPRSKKSVKAQYRRNGGEGKAWRLGAPVTRDQYKEPWVGGGVEVHHNNGAWQITGRTKLWVFLPVKIRFGFEIDNVFCGDYDPQMWYPIDGYELRAPVTWTVMPGR